MKGLYKMDLECGRMGDLEGLFVADCDKIDYLINHEISVYFGEVLGKYSEISSTLDKNDIKLITTDENVIKIIEEYDLENGFNPLEETVCTYETTDWKTTEEDEEIEWADETIEDFIIYRMTGKLPD